VLFPTISASGGLARRPATLSKWLIYPLALGAAVLATVVLVFAAQARMRLPELRPAP